MERCPEIRGYRPTIGLPYCRTDPEPLLKDLLFAVHDLYSRHIDTMEDVLPFAFKHPNIILRCDATKGRPKEEHVAESPLKMIENMESNEFSSSLTMKPLGYLTATPTGAGEHALIAVDYRQTGDQGDEHDLIDVDRMFDSMMRIQA
jgi:hypothetical protein